MKHTVGWWDASKPAADKVRRRAAWLLFLMQSLLNPQPKRDC